MAAASSGSAAVALPGGEPPLMADLMCGPNLPLTKAFLWCGWRTVSVDWLLDPAHDLSNPLRQKSLAGQLNRSADQPLGLPGLSVKDNAACGSHSSKSTPNKRGSVRENPWRSLHWYLPQEQAMMESGLWKDTQYSACVFAGARSKLQCLRHNVQEIEEWPPLMCHHTHHPREWEPQESSDGRWYPSKTEAEYTAVLAFSMVGGPGRQGTPDGPADASDRDGRSPGALVGIRWTSSARVGHGTDGGEPRAQAAPAGVGCHGASASGDPRGAVRRWYPTRGRGLRWTRASQPSSPYVRLEVSVGAGTRLLVGRVDPALRAVCPPVRPA